MKCRTLKKKIHVEKTRHVVLVSRKYRSSVPLLNVFITAIFKLKMTLITHLQIIYKICDMDNHNSLFL